MDSHTSNDGSVTLTEREQEILSQIALGQSSSQAADSLACSKRTIDCHLTRIYEKLHVTNRVQAVRKAVLLGLIPPLDLASPSDNMTKTV